MTSRPSFGVTRTIALRQARANLKRKEIAKKLKTLIPLWVSFEQNIALAQRHISGLSD